MLGKDSVLAQIRTLGLGRSPERLTPMSLVDNTAAAVTATLARRSLDGRWLQVELTERPQMIHPLTRVPVQRPPIAVLKQRAMPLAIFIGELLVVSRAAPRCVRTPLIREARAAILQWELVDQWRLSQLLTETAP